MFKVAAGANTQHLAEQGGWPAALVPSDPGVLQKDCLAKYAVPFQSVALHLDPRQLGLQPCQLHLLSAHRLVTRPIEQTLLAEPNSVVKRLHWYPQNLRRHRHSLTSSDQAHNLQPKLQNVFSPCMSVVSFAHLDLSS